MRDLNEEIYTPELRPEHETLRYLKRTPMPVSAEALFRWHERPGAIQRLTPPWQDVELEDHEGIRDGDLARFKVGFGPLKFSWRARHAGYRPGRQFRDEQIEGPFDTWVHTHRTLPDGENRSILEDEVSFALPFHELTHRFFENRARREIDAMFSYRHRVTRIDLTRHLTYAERPLRVAITGASGLIGTMLSAFLTTGGHEVIKLVRKRGALEDDELYWNPDTTEIELSRLEGLDAVVHLAGEPIFDYPLTREKMDRVRESRERGTLLIASSLARLDNPPPVLVSASTTGYYGSTGDQPPKESDDPGKGFLADVTRIWEAATEPAAAAGIRVATARIGVVIDPRSSALRLVLPFFRYGLGGQIEPGPDWISWVMLEDVLGAIYHVIHRDEISGPFNVTAPEPVSMAEFSTTLGRVLGRPVWLKLPSSLARRFGGSLIDEVALTSARILPVRLKETGFTFVFSDLESGLRHVLGRSSLS